MDAKRAELTTPRGNLQVSLAVAVRAATLLQTKFSVTRRIAIVSAVKVNAPA
jgi:hypothetical protein